MTEQERKELLYISLLALSAAHFPKWKDNSAIEIPELLYILEPDIFLKLVSAYPKKRIRIPSKDEIMKTMKFIMYYQEVLIKGKSRELFLKEAGLILNQDMSYWTERKAVEL